MEPHFFAFFFVVHNSFVGRLYSLSPRERSNKTFSSEIRILVNFPLCSKLLLSKRYSHYCCIHKVTEKQSMATDRFTAHHLKSCAEHQLQSVSGKDQTGIATSVAGFISKDPSFDELIGE